MSQLTRLGKYNIIGFVSIVDVAPSKGILSGHAWVTVCYPKNLHSH
jgi:hypothetical protein